MHVEVKKLSTTHDPRRRASSKEDPSAVVPTAAGAGWSRSVVDAVGPVSGAARKDKSQLLPHLEKLASKEGVDDIIPISAFTPADVKHLIETLVAASPEGEGLFPEDQITNRSSRFLASEIVREKITRQLGDELPYSATVAIDSFEVSERFTEIHATIFVERQGQKRILIGDGGSRLKSIGTEARIDMERLFDNKVVLKLWVKVKSNWSDDLQALRSLGFSDSDT